MLGSEFLIGLTAGYVNIPHGDQCWFYAGWIIRRTQMSLTMACKVGGTDNF